MKIDLFVDLNTEDETGFPWTYRHQATDPTRVVPGRVLVVGAGDQVCRNSDLTRSLRDGCR